LSCISEDKKVNPIIYTEMTDNNYKVSEVHLFYVNIIIPMSYRKTWKDKKVQTNDKEITNGLYNYYYPEIYS
jgi:hypothetical protein